MQQSMWILHTLGIEHVPHTPGTVDDMPWEPAAGHIQAKLSTPAVASTPRKFCFPEKGKDRSKFWAEAFPRSKSPRKWGFDL